MLKSCYVECAYTYLLFRFLGEQLRATVIVSEQTHNTRGILHMVLTHGNSSTNFRIYCKYRQLFK